MRTLALALLLLSAHAARAQHEPPYFDLEDERVLEALDAMEDGEFVLLEQGHEQIAPRRYEPTEGDTLTVDLDLTNNIDSWRNEETGPTQLRPACRLTLEYKVIRVTDSHFTVRIKPVDAGLAPHALAPDDTRHDHAAGTQMMTDSTLTVSRTRSGEITKSDWFPDTVRSKVAHQTRERVAELARIARLPERPFGVGAVWRTRVDGRILGAPLRLLRTTWVVGIEGERVMLYIEDRAHLGEVTSQDPATGAVTKMSPTITYAEHGAEIHTALGLPESAYQDLHITHEAQVTTQAQTITVTTHSHLTLNLGPHRPHRLTEREARSLACRMKPGETRILEFGDDPRPLAFTPREGRSVVLAYLCETVYHQYINGNYPNPETPAERPFRYTTTSTVTKVLPTGVFVVEDTIDEFVYFPLSEEDGEATRELNALLRELVGVTIRYTHAPSGELLACNTPDDNAQLTQLTRDMVDEILALRNDDVFRFPTRPVGVGAVWRTRADDHDGGIDRRHVITYTLAALDERHATVDVVSIVLFDEQDFTSDDLPENSTGHINSASAEGAGRIIVDLWTGNVVNAEIESYSASDITITTPDGRVGVLQMAVEYDYVEELEPPNPEQP